MTITVGDAATLGEKELRRDYPNVVGDTAGTTKQEGERQDLEVQEESQILEDDWLGMR